jgi:N-sulfoglucosamine sulfohydrolase
MNADTPGVFGGPSNVTPTVDQLAENGAVFRRAHVAVAVCQPSRSAMLTGRYPHRNGAEGFQPIRDDVTLLTDVLRAAGYRTGILGKVTHLAPVERFGWDVALDRDKLGDGRSPARYATEAGRFITAAVDADEPFFLMCNSHDPHRPFSGSSDEQAAYGAALADIPRPSKQFAPGEWPTPGFLADLPEVRAEVAQYLSSCRRADDTLRAVIEQLETTGTASNTVVIFLSDNGMAFPFAKANCYLHSTRTPLIVRWPGVVTPGLDDTEHFVSGVDLYPTICEIAGAGVTDGLDGRSFMDLLQGHEQSGRDEIHTVFHASSRNERFEMRCVQNATAGLIWNAWSDGATTYRAENLNGLTWKAMQAASATDPAVRARTAFYETRVPEELYRFDDDPDALVNLANDPNHESLKTTLRSRLLDWMDRTGDPLADSYRQVVNGS